MTIIGVTCVKNEEDIIEAFVRHNLFYLQKLIVLNHGSTDNTPVILSRLVAEGLALLVEDDPSLGKFQGEKMTRLMRRAVNEHGADWVLLLDADEFIRCQQERLPLPEPGNSTGFLKVPFRTYKASACDDQSVINPAERIRHRLKEEPYETEGTLSERRFLLKAIVPRALAETSGVRVVQGNHYIMVFNHEPPHELWTGFDYAHFSLRTVGHYASKIAIGTLQHIYRSSPRANMDSFYLTHLTELTSDFEGFSRRFYERIPSYLELIPSFTPDFIHDPLPYRGGPLRYTSTASDYTRLVANLIGYAEVLAKAASEHAATTRTESNQVEELARLEFFGDESRGVVTHHLSANSNLLQTVRFPLGSPPASQQWRLRIESPASVVELVKVRWIGENSDEAHELNGKHLRPQMHVAQNALLLHHDQYLAFIKGEQNALISLNAPPAGCHRSFVAVEIQIQMETDATRIGARLIHNNNLDRLLGSIESIKQLEHALAQLRHTHARLEYKLAERTTLPGAFGFQIYRLWRAATGPFKRAVS